MPVAEYDRVKTHTGNGVTTNFAYNFKIFADTDLQVVVDGVLQTLTTDYTVNGAGDAGGGSIDFITAPINLSVVTISGELAYERNTDYIENGSMRSETVDDDFDRQIMLDQQLRRDIKRSIKVPIEETDDQEVSFTPANRADKVLGFDALGLPTVLSLTDLTSILTAIDTSLVLASGILSVAIPTRQCVAGGTADAITGVTVPVAGALTNNLRVTFEASGANTITTPTFDLDGLGAKNIVKGSDFALRAGDIPGANARVDLIFDATLDKWVYLNPALMEDAADKTIIQSGGYLYGVGAGAVNVMTTTLSPTLLAYTTGQVFRVKVNLANTNTTPSINVDTIGAKTIVNRDGTALAVGDLPINYIAEFMYDSVLDKVLFMNPTQSVIGVSGTSRNLIIIPNAGTPLTKLDIDADEIMLVDANGRGFLARAVNLTNDSAGTGVDGLDTGTLADFTSDWGYVWAISDGTTVGSVVSLSSTAPTMPTGYTFKALLGAVRVNGSDQYIPFRQEGKRFEYDAVQNMKDGSFTTAAWTSLVVSAIFPPIAKRIKFAFGVNTSITMGLSPRSDGASGYYSRGTSTGVTNDFGGVLTTARHNHDTGEIRYASTVYYLVGTSADATLDGIGWKL